MTLAEHIEARRKWADSLVPDLDAPNDWIEGYLWALSDVEEVFVKATSE